MEHWQKVWREGFAPQISRAGLQSLRKALMDDDRALIQGATTSPPPFQCVQDLPVEGACALGLCGWRGDGLETVGQVENFLAGACLEADRRLQEPAGCRWFLNWFDETPREEMRSRLLVEVQRTLVRRLAEGGRRSLDSADDPAAA